MDNTISEAAALRIALAARQLPAVELGPLLGLLIQHLGEPLTEEKLVGLSPKVFRVMVSSLSEVPSRRDISGALAILTNPGLSDVDAPVVDPDVRSFGSKAIKVAITSNQGEMINGHYGSCLRVLIYEVSESAHQLVDVREVDSELNGEARSDALLDRIRDCQLLFTLSIGGPAAAKVTRANVHPIKKNTPVSAEDTLNELSYVLKTNPPPWLMKCMGETKHYAFAEEE